MTAPRICLELGATVPGPGPEGRYRPVKVGCSVEIDIGDNFESDLALSIEAIKNAAPPLSGLVAEEAANISGVSADDSFRAFRTELNAWQERVVGNIRKLNDVTGLSKPSAAAEIPQAKTSDGVDPAEKKPRRRVK